MCGKWPFPATPRRSHPGAPGQPLPVAGLQIVPGDDKMRHSGGAYRRKRGPGHVGELAGSRAAARRRIRRRAVSLPAVGPGSGRAVHQGQQSPGRWCRHGQGRLQGRIDPNQALQAAETEHSPHQLGGDDRPHPGALTTARWRARATAAAPARSHKMVAVMSTTSAVPRFMTHSSSSRISPAFDTSICSGSVTTA